MRRTMVQDRGEDGMVPGERIHLRRRRQRLTVGQLARLAGIDSSTLSRYEAGRRDIPASILSRIAEALQMTPNELLGYDGHRDKLE